jgi:hypothetical protein
MRLKILGAFVPFFLIFSNFSYSTNYYPNLEDIFTTDFLSSTGCDGWTPALNFSYFTDYDSARSAAEATGDYYRAYNPPGKPCVDGDYIVYVCNKYKDRDNEILHANIIVYTDCEPVCDDTNDDDNDGVYNCFDLCPNTPSNVSVDSDGCPEPCVDNDGDGIPYAFDENNGLQDDYYFRYTTYKDSSGNITGYSIYNINYGTWRKLGNPDPNNDIPFISNEYHSSDLYNHFDCNQFTFNPDSKVSPPEKGDFEEDLNKKPPVDIETEPQIDPNDGDGDGDGEEDGAGSGNYATREDAAAVEGAIKENTRVIRQDGEATRYSIDKGFTDTSQKLTKTNDILEDLKEDLESSDYTHSNSTDDLSVDSENIDSKVAELSDKFSVRFDDFLDTVQSSPLFSLSDSMFGSMPSSSTSELSYDLGYWGSSEMQSGSFDFSDYTSLFDVLRACLLFLTAYMCFLIVTNNK